MAVVEATAEVDERPGWRAVGLPSEHGGWGLTLEPVLLGLLAAWSIAGAALGVAAFLAFLVRTPAKLVAVDVRRRRWLGRSQLALRIATVEAALLLAAIAVATALSGWGWLVPVLVASPLVAVEVWFEVRSRGRRLVPELCGAVAVASVSASIVIAAGAGGRLAAGVWLVLTARVVGAIPFVRVQIFRLRRGAGAVWHSDVAQLVAVAVAVVAVVVDRRLAAGATVVAALAVVQSVWVRRAPMPAKRIGVRQMLIGLVLVVVSAVGILV